MLSGVDDTSNVNALRNTKVGPGAKCREEMFRSFLSIVTSLGLEHSAEDRCGDRVSHRSIPRSIRTLSQQARIPCYLLFSLMTGLALAAMYLGVPCTKGFPRVHGL